MRASYFAEQLISRTNTNISPFRHTWHMPRRHQLMLGRGRLQASGTGRTETEVFAHSRGQNLLRRSAEGVLVGYGWTNPPPSMPGGPPPEQGTVLTVPRSPMLPGMYGGASERKELESEQITDSFSYSPSRASCSPVGPGRRPQARARSERRRIEKGKESICRN